MKSFFIRRTFTEEFERHVIKGSGNRQLSPKRPPFSNLEVVGLLGNLRDRWRAPDMKHLKLIRAPIFMDPVYVRSQIWGQSQTAVKYQGSHDLASEYGVLTACFKGRGALRLKGLKSSKLLNALCQNSFLTNFSHIP